MPGTWRYLGLVHGPIDIGQIPIAGRSPAHIRALVRGRCLPAAHVREQDAFLLRLSDGRRLLYVNRDFKYYRRLAQRVFADPPSFRVDYDHALAKKLARLAGYKYVLLLRIPPHINRSHGSFEGKIKVAGPAGAVAFVDRRILDKWLSRRPRLFSGRNPLRPYIADARPDGGFTLKQLGRVAFALGWGENWKPNPAPARTTTTTARSAARS
jgi:hypothetical protein